jgi:hypothetical protein
MLAGSTLQGCGFIDCQFVVVMPVTNKFAGVAVFNKCMFIDTKFLGCTLFVFPEQMEHFHNSFQGKHLEVITIDPRWAMRAALKAKNESKTGDQGGQT